MANLFAPKGFQVVRSNAGGTAGRLNDHQIPSGLAENIFTGDVVKSDGAGGIQLAAAGDVPIGIFQGCHYTLASGEEEFSQMWRTGTLLKDGTVCHAQVADDQNQTMKVQCSGTLAQANVGNLVDLDAAVAGNEAYGQSGMAIGAATGTTFRVDRILHPIERNDEGMSVPTEDGLYAIAEVSFVLHVNK